MWIVDNNLQHEPHWPCIDGGREAYIASTIAGRHLQVVTRAGHIDWPIQYPDGRIAYDFPERVPIYLQLWVDKALNLDG